MERIMKNPGNSQNLNSITETLIILLLLVLLSGCAGSSYNYAAYSAAADRDFTKAIDVLEKTSKPLKEYRPSDLVLLTRSYLRVKNYQKLVTCLDEMERRIDAGQDDYFIDDGSLSGYPTKLSYDYAVYKADMHLEFGQFEEAIAVFYKYPHLLEDNGDQDSFHHLTYNHSRLGLARELKGDRHRAEDHLAVLETLHQELPERCKNSGWCIDVARSMIAAHGGLGALYMAMGRYQDAHDYVQESMGGLFDGLYKVVGLNLHLLPRQFVVAKTLFETGHYQESKQAYDSMLAFEHIDTNGYIYWNVLFDRGRIASKEGRHAEAIGFYKRAVEVIEAHRSNINSDVAKIGFVGDKQQVYQHLIETLLAENRIAEAFEYVERSKARSLVELLASKKDFAMPATSNDAVAVMDALADAEMASAIIDTSSDTGTSGQRSARAIEIKQRLTAEAPELASLVTVTSLKAKEIQALLPSDEALVEYYVNGATLVAFVVTRDNISAVPLDGKGLEERIRAYRQALGNPKSNQYQAAGQRLYQRLLAPLSKKIDPRRLLIVAHGSLHYLPFNALHDGRGYLIDSYSVRMLPSASVMNFLRARNHAEQNNLLVLGNPDLGDARYDLAYAQQEARAITAGRANTSVLLRKQATETAVKQNGIFFRQVHFASHGEFDPEAPLNSGLLLAADNENDGRLTVGELYSLKLNADLVTLSACQTALGKVASGDDVIGFTRGFLYAGASSIVSSLWSVDDRATRDLMVRFYQNLDTGDKAQALREAQRSVKQQSPHPYYWAAFQLVGDRR